MKNMKSIIAMTCALVLLLSAAAFAEEFKSGLPENFLFCSGAGAWGTSLTVNADFSFSGEYHDSEMGEFTEEYEYGTYYISTFTGNFSEPQVNEDGTVSMTVESIRYLDEPGSEYIEDGIRYVAEESYGISQGDEFVFYPAGYATDKVPENAIEWISGLYGWWEEGVPDALTYDLLYNSVGEYPFVQD